MAGQLDPTQAFTICFPRLPHDDQTRRSNCSRCLLSDCYRPSCRGNRSIFSLRVIVPIPIPTRPLRSAGTEAGQNPPLPPEAGAPASWPRHCGSQATRIAYVPGTRAPDTQVGTGWLSVRASWPLSLASASLSAWRTPGRKGLVGAGADPEGLMRCRTSQVAMCGQR